jgi:hypothetical protein
MLKQGRFSLMKKRPCKAQSMQEICVFIIVLYEHHDARHKVKSIHRLSLRPL